MARVLVADDSPTVRHLLCPILRKASHVVSEAANGEEALAVLYRSQSPMIVLLDVVMPKLGGIGVLHEMEASPVLRGRHAFILMTAPPEAIPPKAVAELLQRFSIPLVLKPLDPAHLLILVDQAAERLHNDTGTDQESNQRDTF